MPKKKSDQPLTSNVLQNLLADQSKVILDAVDERFTQQDKKMGIMEIRILAKMDKMILASEERINRKIDKLTTTLDKFLKRMTDMEDEFTIMKHDLNRVKSVLKEKLGVDLS